jgi:ABC-2 type transport system permease protein
MLSTPTSVRTVVAGQLLGRLVIALLQALIIVLGSPLFFSLSWGNPIGTAALIFMFSLVGTGAALLIGSLFSSEQQAGPVALLPGLGLAALGGSMVPLELFPSTARTIAHVTPHARGPTTRSRSCYSIVATSPRSCRSSACCSPSRQRSSPSRSCRCGGP